MTVLEINWLVFDGTGFDFDRRLFARVESKCYLPGEVSNDVWPGLNQ